MNKSDQNALLQYISEVSFALDDCVLYLDTHPCDLEALKYYKTYRDLRKQAVEEYTNCYGPLSDEDVNVTNYWTWVTGPWPWEGEC